MENLFPFQEKLVNDEIDLHGQIDIKTSKVNIEKNYFFNKDGIVNYVYCLILLI